MSTEAERFQGQLWGMPSVSSLLGASEEHHAIRRNSTATKETLVGAALLDSENLGFVL